MKAYILIPIVAIIICAACGMRCKYRKEKPWAEGHHLKRDVAQLKYEVQAGQNPRIQGQDNDGVEINGKPSY